MANIHVITIIGNGFDFQLGCKTSYSSFFEWLKKDADSDNNLEPILITFSEEQLEEMRNMFSNYEKSFWGISKKPEFRSIGLGSNTAVLCWETPDYEIEVLFYKNIVVPIKQKINVNNLWTLFFLYQNFQYTTWANVEEEIEKNLNKKLLKQAPSIETPGLNIKQFFEYYFKTGKSDVGGVTLYMFYDLFVEYRKEFKLKKNKFKFLLDELKKFEAKFAEYLNTENVIPAGYKTKSQELAKKLLIYPVLDTERKQENNYKIKIVRNICNRIIWFDYRSGGCYRYNDYHVDNFLINFNFNEVFVGSTESENADPHINVHGYANSKVSSDIVFGIDETAAVEKGAEIFKKTHRKLFMAKQPEIELPASCDYIQFYGHSLAKADYSYFQSLFDHYDLYGGKTKIVFYINDRVEDVTEKTNAIYSLFHAYGEEVLGEMKGRNLLHKLQLENRVAIITADMVPEVFEKEENQ
jgi:hypothetical protein